MKKSKTLTAFQFVQYRELFGSVSQQRHLEQYLFTDYRGTPTRVDVPSGARTVFFLVISPDKSLFAAAHGDHTVRVYCAMSGTLVSTKIGHPRSLWCLQFHPYNPDILASSCLGGELRIWDLTTSLDSVWRTKQGEVIASLSFHPKETLLAAATGTDIVFYNWKESQLHMIWRLAHPESKIRWLKFSTLGDALFTGICNRPDGDEEVNSVMSNFAHPSNKNVNNVESVYWLIRKKWSRMSNNPHSHTSRSPNRLYSQQFDNISASSCPNLNDVARSLFSNSEHYSPLFTEQTEDGMDCDGSEAYPIAFLNDDSEAETRSSQMQGEAPGLCSRCVDSSERDSLPPKKRKFVPTCDSEYSHPSQLSSVIDSVISTSSSSTPAVSRQSLNPDNSTFECLEMFKRQMDARSQSSAAGKSKLSRLEQQIYGSGSPSSSQQSLNSSLFSRLSTPESSSPSTSQSSNSSPAHRPCIIKYTSGDERNRPRPVQVLAANAVVEPPHPSSFVVKTAESQRLDTPIFNSPNIDNSTSSLPCRKCGSTVSSNRSAKISTSLSNPSSSHRHSQFERESDSSLHANVSDPVWMALESRLVGSHPDYAVRILDETVNMAPPIRQMINQTLANVVFGREESSLTTNLPDCTYKIQYWPFNDTPLKSTGDLSWTRNIKPQMVVPSCKLHNDSSISLSSDSRLLAAFVPSRQCPDESVLSVYSCVPGSGMGHCLYTKKFGPNAISVEFSSADDLLLVGLASRRIPQRLCMLDETMGQVYRLHEALAGEKSMRLLCNLHHMCRRLPRSELSINGLIWSRNAGVIYATSAGSIFLMQATLNRKYKDKPDLLKTVGTQTLPGDDATIQTTSNC